MTTGAPSHPERQASLHPPSRRVTGLVLAGGRGTRMGGVDKGLQLLDGQPLAARALARLAPQVDALLLSANRNHAAYQALGAPVVSDASDAFSGPLAGILAGMQAAQTAWLCVVPCDAPFFPLDLVARLRTALDVTHADIAFAGTHTDEVHRGHPVLALLKTSLRADLAAFLAADGRKVAAWYLRHKAVEVPFPDDSAFYNVNTLQELGRIEGA